MSIRLAAGKSISPIIQARSLSWRMRRAAANDNGGNQTSGELLQSALRHFGQHGLAAAHQALQEAELAAANGDIDARAFWQDICSVLDRRLAQTLEGRLIVAANPGTN